MHKDAHDIGSDRFRGKVFEISATARDPADPADSVDRRIRMTAGLIGFAMPAGVREALRSRSYRPAGRVYPAGPVASAAGK